MAGIYIHIPFCRQKCYYCDFYKTVNTSQTENFLSALGMEIVQRKGYINNQTIQSIYFGGGTPSVLKEKEVAGILNDLYKIFTITDAEITFEVNPDDLTPGYLKALKQAGVNRLSIGIQSFNNKLLKLMNRRHNSAQAKAAILNACSAGFNNLSVDLIYGIPGLSTNQWTRDLREIFQFPVVHLSAYHLTYHQGTPFYTWLKKGSLKELPETKSVQQFHILLDEASNAGFEQYELSNFARNQVYSLHNKAHWFGETYLGIGPSAHSFNGDSRRWNVAHLEAYINGINKSIPYFEEEQLTGKDKFNEYILTRIRTRWGISITEVQTRFGVEKVNHVKNTATKFINSGKMREADGTYVLTRDGMFVSDNLITYFMMT
jgi:oxygen-independent coproporphyrinogen-3 oxidase